VLTELRVTAETRSPAPAMRSDASPASQSAVDRARAPSPVSTLYPLTTALDHAHPDIGGAPVTVPTAPNSVIGLPGGRGWSSNEQTAVPGADFRYYGQLACTWWCRVCWVALG